MAVFTSQMAYFPSMMEIEGDATFGNLHDVPIALLSPVRHMNMKLPFAASRDRSKFVGYDVVLNKVWFSLFSARSIHPPERVAPRVNNCRTFNDISLAISACGTRVAEGWLNGVGIYTRNDLAEWKKTHFFITGTSNVQNVAFFPSKDSLAVMTRENRVNTLRIYKLLSNQGVMLLSYIPNIPTNSRPVGLHVSKDEQTYDVMLADTSIWRGNLSPLVFDLRKEYSIFAAISRDFDRKALALVAAHESLVDNETSFYTMYSLQAFLFAYFENSLLLAKTGKHVKLAADSDVL